MKKNNKGFTLIELLAIIVILAIIAVITVPIILNIIDNSKKGAAIDSAYGYKDAVNKFYIAELQNHNKLKLNETYTVNSDGSLTAPGVTNPFGEENYDSLKVPVSGTIPSSGSLKYENNVLKSGWLVIGDYKVEFKSDGTVTTAKNTDSSSNIVENNNSTPTWDIFYYFYDDDIGSEDEDGWYSIAKTDFSNAYYGAYAREDSKTHEKEICIAQLDDEGNSKDYDSAICLAPNKWDCGEIITDEEPSYTNDWAGVYHCSNSTGYIQSKINEINNYVSEEDISFPVLFHFDSLHNVNKLELQIPDASIYYYVEPTIALGNADYDNAILEGISDCGGNYVIILSDGTIKYFST